METRGSLIAEAAGRLAAAGRKDPRRLARRLVATALAISPAELFCDPGRIVEAHEADRVRHMLSRMASGEPLSRILGRREFWGLDLSLSAATLDPRPETEIIVEAVLRRQPDRAAPLRFLDLGTGSGCLLLALLSEFSQASGLGVDIAEAAVATAARNAAALGLAERALFAVGDWAEAVSGKFDAVVANPPYIATAELALLPPEVACYDPRRALDGGEDGLAAYRAIAADLPRILAPGGIFAAEVGVDQAHPVAEIIAAHGLSIEAIEKDLAGIMRCVIARVTAGPRLEDKKGLEYPAVPSRVTGFGSWGPRRQADVGGAQRNARQGQGMRPMD